MQRGWTVAKTFAHVCVGAKCALILFWCPNLTSSVFSMFPQKTIRGAQKGYSVQRAQKPNYWKTIQGGLTSKGIPAKQTVLIASNVSSRQSEKQSCGHKHTARAPCNSSTLRTQTRKLVVNIKQVKKSRVLTGNIVSHFYFWNGWIRNFNNWAQHAPFFLARTWECDVWKFLAIVVEVQRVCFAVLSFNPPKPNPPSHVVVIQISGFCSPNKSLLSRSFANSIFFFAKPIFAKTLAILGESLATYIFSFAKPLRENFREKKVYSRQLEQILSQNLSNLQ